MLQAEFKDRIRSVIKNDSRFNAIRRVSVFGSYVDGSATADSDIDLLVDFVPGSIGLLAFSEIRDVLADKLQMKVDLLTEKSISSYFRDDILSSAELVYER